MDEEREELTRYLKSNGRSECPSWYAQLRIAQTLHCAPWEAFPEDATPREVWARRAVDVMHAERDAQEYQWRKQRLQRRSVNDYLTPRTFTTTE